MGVPNRVAASQSIDAYTALREQLCRDPSLWKTDAELQRQIYRHARLWKWELISKRSRFSSLIHLKKLAAILVMLGFVSWLWFGVSTYQAPRTTFPYYDTQKPVPPWSEPMPLEGNYGRGQEHN
jgi:hypothetical protein